MGINTGSLIQARIEVNIFAIIIIPIILIGIFFIIRYLLKLSDAYHKSEKYSEKKKNSPTTKKEISDIAKTARLTKEEKDILAEICAKHPLPNISYMIKNTQDFEPLYRECFAVYESAKNEISKTNLFSLRGKIQKTFRKTPQIKNSRAIPEGSTLIFTPSKGIHLALKVAESQKDEFLISIPKNLKNSPDAPESLSIIELIYVSKDYSAWHLSSRVVRYQEGKENSDTDIMVCTHTDKIEALRKRESDREDLMTACSFSSVTIETKINGKNSVIEYKQSEKTHTGILADISTGGCRIITKLPIKADQYIHIDGKFNRKENDSATGLIIRTTKTKNQDYILHIRFIKISTETVNRINAMICRFDTAENVSY